MTKWVYGFGPHGSDGDAGLRNLLGGKGANLAEMSRLGLPVPPGFTITTGVCTAFYENDRQYPGELNGQVEYAPYLGGYAPSAADAAAFAKHRGAACDAAALPHAARWLAHMASFDDAARAAWK